MAHPCRAFGAPFGLDPSEERNEETELMEIAMKDKVDESMPRVYKADETNDPKNLDRRGQRNACSRRKRTVGNV